MVSEMWMRCPAVFCKKPFQINRFGAGFSSAAQRGRIVCPHCAMTILGDGNSTFLTHALSTEQEEQLSGNFWNQEKLRA
jgi:hypothetical protein